MIRRPPTTTLLPLLASAALLLPAGWAFADPTVTARTTEAPPTVSDTTTVPAPPSPETSAPTTTTATPTQTTETTTVVPAPPEVRAQRHQRSTVKPSHKGTAKSPAHSQTSSTAHANANAVSPATLTPPLPSTLGGSIAGVPSFFIDSFSIPPFLLPIYQAAGAAYGIPWQVLAAINEVETDYGRDLSVSSAGAEGWMQFMPSTWAQYGVDVNRDGFQDPYNPADAIFAAARYLKQSGGDTDIRAAVFSYNHSQAYVNSVMLRARLLGGTPPQLLGAITGLTESRFPVYAAAHYSDGFPSTEGVASHTVPGTTIYTQADAPVIAVQDGRITQIENPGPLGPSISLRDAYGNTYTYAGLGTLATLYPVLEAVEAKRSARASNSLASFGSGTSSANPVTSGATRVFRAGSDNVYLHPLHVGAQVIAGTVLGHVASSTEPHVVFQIRPAGAPPVDPKPILDGWVKLQSSAVVKAKGRDPFARITPTPGQALLESKTQLDQQVPRDRGIHLAPCERQLISDGRVDRRVLAALAYLSASGMKPTVSARSCGQTSTAGAEAIPAASQGLAIDISAVNGQPVDDSHGPTSIATVFVHKLGQLQGVTRPVEIASSTRFAGAANSVALPGVKRVIQVSFTALGGANARAAGFGAGLTPAQWLKLVSRLGQVPDPAVGSKPSSAAIPDPSTPAAARQEGK
ncbi:MAG TPA: lytic murein transglycosylase [Solirubrobacteraceae bacterium]|jgi:hypothetical protein